MTHREAVRRIIDGIRADLDDYPRLHELLEAQFHAALNHHSGAIHEIAQSISQLTSVLETRRRERHGLARLLMASNSPVVSIEAVSARLPRAVRETFDTAWNRLEGLVHSCKTLNLRNCRLVMGQYEILQRVLQADKDTYAPV
jgi:flagella synthesis protein FlgN